MAGNSFKFMNLIRARSSYGDFSDLPQQKTELFGKLLKRQPIKCQKKISRALALAFLPAVILKQNTKKTGPKYGIHPIVSEGIVHKIIL